MPQSRDPGGSGRHRQCHDQLSYTTIQAPLYGRTGLRQVDQGNIVHAADTGAVVQIAQIEPIAVIFTAAGGGASGILKAEGQGPLKVRTLSANGKAPLAEGELTLMNNQIDSGHGNRAPQGEIRQ